MPDISTYDFDVTKNEECFESIPYLDAQANDKVYMLLHQFGNLKLMKRSASYGGSEKELVISNGVGYQIKLYESETDQLEVHETLGASYTIYRVNPENESIPIVRGSITVNPRAGESAPAYRIEQRAMLYVTGSEMPDASKYPEGTVVSMNGVLYVQKSGEWEGVGGASEYITEVHEWRLNKDTWINMTSANIQVPGFYNKFVDRIEGFVYYDSESAQADAARTTGGLESLISGYKSTSFIAIPNENTQIQMESFPFVGAGLSRVICETIFNNLTINYGNDYTMELFTYALTTLPSFYDYIHINNMNFNIRLVIYKLKPLTPVQTIEEEPKK